MIQKLQLTILCSILILFSSAQIPGGNGGVSKKPAGGGPPNNANFNIGHFFGKIVDSNSKGQPNVSLVLSTKKFDQTVKKMVNKVVKTILSEKNGDFSFEGLSLMGTYNLKIACEGFKILELPIKFDVNMGASKNGGSGGFDFNQIASVANKDLGNIKLTNDVNTLQTVSVTSSKSLFELGIDRKIFNVDKNIVSSGQTAVEVMKNIPSLNVDIDGNVTLRNVSPTIYIDGKPTLLTLDQIPADIIEKVEIISNPSAKFDANEGSNGIINIVLKKNRKQGYNGNIFGGIDSRGKPNLGALFNLRTKKFNFSIIANNFTRKSIGTNIYDRNSVLNNNTNTIHSNSDNTSEGAFRFVRGGFDFFPDNRNTISLYQVYVQGQNNQTNEQRIDSTNNINSTNNYVGYNLLHNKGDFKFENNGTQLSYKHNFQQSGHELTADINYNSSTNFNNSYTTNEYFYPNNTPKLIAVPTYPIIKIPSFNQATNNSGDNKYLVIQTDYENPISDKFKIDAGVRFAQRNITSKSVQSVSALNSAQIPILNNGFKYEEDLFAGYTNISIKKNKWSYQFGVRLESRKYIGTNQKANGADSNSFNIDFPLNILPSVFVTYKINDKQDFQFNYSKKASPPNFFQLSPFPNYSDPQNVQVGNPKLNSQVNNIFELVYNNAYKNGANFFASVYYRYSTDLITNNVYKGLSDLNQTDSVLFNSYINANSSTTYGLELSNKIGITKWWDFNVSLNVFNSSIVSTQQNTELNNVLWSWNTKMNNSFKIAKGWSLQFSGQYQAKTVLPASSANANSGGGGGGGGRGGGGGGGPFGGGAQSFANGYNLPRYVFDLGLKKDISWKNGTSLSLSLSVSDIFKTEFTESVINNNLYTQTSKRYRDQQLIRLNIRYQFGKFDLNIFRRKSNKAEGADNELNQ